MKKSHIALIVIVAIVVAVGIFICSPFTWLFGGLVFEITNGNSAEIEIDSYRLCEDKDGEDIIIIKYSLSNTGKQPTQLFYEGDFYVYQEGISLTEYVDELPKECDYDPEDQYKNIKGGVKYYAEIAYILEYPDKDVEVEVDDYGLFSQNKEKTFKLN
ncbi:MAG: DUF5067 domain-containing protein [Clostridia bacterium]|nr:DUF5067 domain-containing protein [Clostridia bacterium]